MNDFYKNINAEINKIHQDGLYKDERVLASNQSTKIIVNNKEVLNFCSNNYLGLSSHPRLIKAAKKIIDDRGFGLSSVRFICGTQDIHKELEVRISKFLNMQDTILYTSCFDANGGLFETLLDDQDAIISDSLNHASIIDGVRLCKAKRFRFENSNMNQLEDILKNTQDCRSRLITTDGVFSMDGYIAKLDAICSLAEKYNALVHVDDSHATGFIGKRGLGTPEHCNVIDKVDIITSTFGKALGGASGGFTSGKKEIIEMLRQRSRPYLFSNSVPPVIVGATIEVLNILSESTALRDVLEKNTTYFRQEMRKNNFNIKEGIHPIVPIMIGDAKTASNFARDMLTEKIYVIGFSFPVVPKGEARIRVQISAAHKQRDLDQAIKAFIKIGRKYL